MEMNEPQGEKVFEMELKLIANNEVRNLVVEVLRLAPRYFWEVPSSTSGRHHPPDENRPGGKVYQKSWRYRSSAKSALCQVCYLS